MKKSLKMLKIFALCLTPICISGCFGGGSTNTNTNGNNTTNTNTNGNDTTNTKTEENKTVDVTEVTFDQTEVELRVGDSVTINATVAPENATKPELTWSTSKSSVAKVEGGVVQAVGVGTATIKAKTSNGKYAECTVSVTDYSVTSVTLNKHEITLETGMTFQLTATVLPEDAEDKNITWTSGSSTRVSVSDSGLVSALKAGSAVTITAKSSNGKKDTCKVTVVDTPVIEDKKFAYECTYIYSGSFEFNETSIQYDTRYNFKPDGSVKIKNNIDKTEKDRTYRIDDGMLNIFNGEEIDERFFYYDNVLLAASLMPVSLVKDGSAVSSAGTGLLGYYAIIQVSVNSTLAALTGDENSAGYYVKLQGNGQLVSNKFYYINSDQITSNVFDACVAAAGTYVVKINIGGKLYNCLFIVK